MWPTPEPLAFPLCPRHTGVNPITRPRPLELRQAAQDAQHEPPSRATGVDALAKGREPYPGIRERLDGVYEVGETTAEAVQLPAHDDIELPTFRVGHQLVE